MTDTPGASANPTISASPPAETIQTPAGFTGDRGNSKRSHLLRAALVGLIAGLLAVGFKWSLSVSEQARVNLLSIVHAFPGSNRWGWAVLPVIGLIAGSLVGWLVVRFAPDAPGSGIPHVKGVLLHVRSMRWKWLIPVKFVGGALGIGAGLSLGREGPTVQMGAAVGQAIADTLRVPSRAVPQLLSCGAGAGIAGAFNAPLAGFLFVIEELHRELSARTFAGALVAAITADVVARTLGSDLSSFAISGYPSIPLAALPVAILLGGIGGVLGPSFNRLLLGSSAAARRITAVPRWLQPGIACAACGFVAWWLPDAVGGGHATAERLLEHPLVWSAAGLILLFLVKFGLTLVSYASGAPGGIFAPMLLLGALSGAIVGQGVCLIVPSLQPHGTAFAILGMAAFFSGSVRAPLTGIVLIVEMTGNYQQMLALAIVCLVADLTAGSIGGRPIYESLLEADLRRHAPSSGSSKEISAPRTIYIGVQRGSGLEGRSIRESGVPSGCLIIGIERGGREIYPDASLTLLSGDHITVIVPEDEPAHTTQLVRLATGL